MYILDTDTLSHLHEGHPRVSQRFQAAVSSGVTTTIVTKVEMLRGRIEFLLKAATGTEMLRAQQWFNLTEERLAEIGIVPLDLAATEQFERLVKIRGLRKIGRADLLIASIALSCDATLVTRNLRHFQAVPRLDVENWVD